MKVLCIVISIRGIRISPAAITQVNLAENGIASDEICV